MTLDEAIKHAEEVAEEQEKAAKEWHENQVRKCELIRFAEMDYTHENACRKCAEDHRQLVGWLKELKQLREQTRWIPVSERLPEERDWMREAIKALEQETQRQGRWLHREDMDYLDKSKVMHNHFMCKDCGFIHDFIDGHTAQYKYCPQCGCLMIEPQESE